MNSTPASRRASTIRNVGWLSVASMLALALLAPTTNAQTGNQSGTDIPWNSVEQECSGGPNGDFDAVPGMVAWVFVHPQVSGPGTLSAHFLIAGDVTAPSYVQGNVKYIIWTGFDTLQTFSDDLDGGVLNLSHVCAGEQPTEQPTTPPTEQPTTPPTEQPTTPPTEQPTTPPTEQPTTPPTEQPTTPPTEQPTTPPTEQPTTPPTEQPTTPPTEQPTTPPTEQPTTPPTPFQTVLSETDAPTTPATATPFQTVLSETDAPSPGVTLPPTDVPTGTTGPSIDGWRILLIAAAALLASVLVVAPATASRRRR